VTQLCSVVYLQSCTFLDTRTVFVSLLGGAKATFESLISGC